MTTPNPTLRPCTRYIIGHNATAESIFLPAPDLHYHSRFGSAVARAYSLPRVPAPLDHDADLKLYLAPDDGTTATACSGQINKVTVDGGVNSVYMDMRPGACTPMHRTVSVDLVVVVQGVVELELDSGERRVLYSGDTVVQRGTMHRWRNVSYEEPARMLAILMASEKVFVGGRELKQEYLSG